MAVSAWGPTCWASVRTSASVSVFQALATVHLSTAPPPQVSTTPPGLLSTIRPGPLSTTPPLLVATPTSPLPVQTALLLLP
ncbi:hypothetical protein PF001_g25956 [Phytophthora fragariae]|uniref:Uncharacterized protein n=1 Tax=Phytophthora fragariae TaxID=53985 RepID=A0A6A4BUS6_9STRA|nr:hypothetical protein PF006_g25835 [Phytophthora fragariae]KAE9276807.1 hypothetical protein PF001_g25956 [Phytophthora fragariae]